MDILIIGLGSMGKRRIRCLNSLNYDLTKVSGFDLREDRRNEVQKLNGIQVFGNFEEAMTKIQPEILIISVPPDVHHIYMKEAIARNIHFFVEASVVDTDLEVMIGQLKEKKIVAAPSVTLMFHPAILKVKEIVNSGILGKISNFIHHSGQYLPDWHTYEKVADYYVSNPATGGGREIVPFEMGWIANIFGIPEKVSSMVRKTIDIEGASEIDDTYNILMDYNDSLGVLIVDVVSRKPIRRLVVNGSAKQMTWDWNENYISIFDPVSGTVEKVSYAISEAAEGYHSNIGEGMYIDEMRLFLDTVKGNGKFINTLEEDHRILKILYACENSQNSERFIKIDF